MGGGGGSSLARCTTATLHDASAAATANSGGALAQRSTEVAFLFVSSQCPIVPYEHVEVDAAGGVSSLVQPTTTTTIISLGDQAALPFPQGHRKRRHWASTDPSRPTSQHGTVGRGGHARARGRGRTDGRTGDEYATGASSEAVRNQWAEHASSLRAGGIYMYMDIWPPPPTHLHPRSRENLRTRSTKCWAALESFGNNKKTNPSGKLPQGRERALSPLDIKKTGRSVSGPVERP